MQIWHRYKDVVRANWHLGFTAFGGPPVQFQTFHKKFVEDLAWIDEPMYQQIFAISQALPGSASVKMLFTINAIHGGYGAGILAFLLFCLPGALGMYSLAVGIARVGTVLPAPVYALLSGLNAATVGIIALAAVRLAERAITDKLTRALVILGGIIGMLHTALWYYPAIMVAAGLTPLLWDLKLFHGIVGRLRRWRVGRRMAEQESIDNVEACHSSWPRNTASTDEKPPHPAPLPVPGEQVRVREENPLPVPFSISESQYAYPPPSIGCTESSTEVSYDFPQMSWQFGTCILVLFLILFVTTVVIRSVIQSPPRGFSIFANLYIAGTIVFGGGPVVVPLLREYIVDQGWVSPRDFLLGLAIIQAFPGPNFNFAIYLGTLATTGSGLPSFIGAAISFVAVHTPGLMIVYGFMGIWKTLRLQPWFLSILRGITPAAVGLVYTAVYKLWQIGHMTKGTESGQPLGSDPWLVGITAAAFAVVAWYKINPPTAIVLGGIMGISRYAILDR